VMALKQIQSANPALYDPIAVDRMALQAVGWSNPEQFMVPPEALGPQQSPEAQAKMAELQIKKQDSDTKAMVGKAKVALDFAKAQQDSQQGGLVAPAEKSDHEKKVDAIDLIIKEKMADAKMMDAKVKGAGLALTAKKDQFDGRIKEEEMMAKQEIEKMQLAERLSVHPESQAVVYNMMNHVLPTMKNEGHE